MVFYMNVTLFYRNLLCMTAKWRKMEKSEDGLMCRYCGRQFKSKSGLSNHENSRANLMRHRKFSYNTCRSTVYNLVEKAEPEHTGDVGISTRNTAQNNLPDNITLKSHTFDMPERGRLAGKNKYSTVSLDRNSLQKGSLGVRWKKARTNESKMLPSQRMGIQYDQNETTVLKK
ncbi:uncharacterized protein LOC123529028 isoform X1 [Mercenaria mercenaria]|uniref:uncharacterized protein LOC123529028 isoform X1 n=2 Tax=Mercenaria mercenaria TaxID=6596 RepID=UPI001E1D7CDF|nr:uncharacterized protein LOC123529028 isoform X1 [Mercenaria mercenaria]